MRNKSSSLIIFASCVLRAFIFPSESLINPAYTYPNLLHPITNQTNRTRSPVVKTLALTADSRLSETLPALGTKTGFRIYTEPATDSRLPEEYYMEFVTELRTARDDSSNLPAFTGVLFLFDLLRGGGGVWRASD
jgi:hypothetical protein